MAAAVTANWNPLGNDYYSRYDLYEMAWKGRINLFKYKIATSSYGGPIALVLDKSKLQQQRVPSSYKSTVYVYNAAGVEISSFSWESGQKYHMAWSASEELLCIRDDGVVLVYDIHGDVVNKTVTLGNEPKDHGILDCKVFSSHAGTGIAIITGQFKFIITNSYEFPKLRPLADVPLMVAPPSAWCVLSNERATTALVASDKRLYLLNVHSENKEMSLPVEKEYIYSSFNMIVASLDYKRVALHTDTGYIFMCSYNLRQLLSVFDTESRQSVPKQLIWCGPGAVIAYWESTRFLLVIAAAKQRNWIRFTVDEDVHIVPEIDGVRILSDSLHERIHQVDASIDQVFRIGSMAPGSMLVEASRYYEKRDPKVDEFLRLIKDNLELAVGQCVQAAGCASTASLQKCLLRAASLGKCFTPGHDPEPFVNTCRLLRVLNAINDFTVGIPLTMWQLQKMTIDVLIDRLVARRHFPLSLKICDHLRVPDKKTRVLAFWAKYKVCQKNLGENEVYNVLHNKLHEVPGISYSEISAQALLCGRKELAVKLMDLEPKSSEQVSLLLQIGEPLKALDKAIASGNVDQIYNVVLTLKASQMKQDEFLKELRRRPVAESLYLKYCKQLNPDILSDIYYQNDNHLEFARCKIDEAYREDSYSGQVANLQVAMEEFTKGKDDLSAKLTEEQIRLLKHQRDLEMGLHQTYLNLSLQDTMYNLILQGKTKTTEHLRKEFKVADRQYWYIKVRALSSLGDWLELEKFSRVGSFDLALDSALSESDIDYVVMKAGPSRTDIKQRAVSAKQSTKILGKRW